MIGNSAGRGSTDGGDVALSHNVLIGAEAGKDSQQAHGNVAIGHSAFLEGAGKYNTNIGFNAGRGGTDHNYSTHIGYSAGHDCDGDNNVYLGYQAGKTCAGDNNIEFVTNGASPSILNGYSDKIHIENTIVGDTDARRLAIGLVGVGDVSPDATLEIKPSGTTTVGLIVQGASSQTANLAEFQNSSETSLVSIEADGSVIISSLPTSDPTNAGQLWRDGTDLKVSLG